MADPSKLQITPCGMLVQGNQINFTKLYLHHTPAGPEQNQSAVTSNDKKTGLGCIVVNNWSVYDGIGSDAKLVAYAKGLHVFAGAWHNSFSLVFEDERLKGSTLQVMGLIVEEGDWAIVGGTGQFAMATGVILKKMQEQKQYGNIIELTIHGFCPLLKGSQCPVTKIGPWGSSHEGTVQDITESPKRLESITLYHGWSVDSISFTYLDHAGEKHKAGPWGGPGGDPIMIEFGSSEFLKEVSGTFGPYEGSTVITSINFITNKQTYGPFGRQEGTPFSVPAQNNSSIVGFFGRSGKYINAVGVYVQPT